MKGLAVKVGRGVGIGTEQAFALAPSPGSGKWERFTLCLIEGRSGYRRRVIMISPTSLSIEQYPLLLRPDFSRFLSRSAVY